MFAKVPWILGQISETVYLPIPFFLYLIINYLGRLQLVTQFGAFSLGMENVNGGKEVYGIAAGDALTTELEVLLFVLILLSE